MIAVLGCSLLATLAGMFRTACIPIYETSNSLTSQGSISNTQNDTHL